MSISLQTAWLFLLSIPIACCAWTITHEEIFKEPRDYCKTKSEGCKNIFARKFFYLFTCEYCFSHYVTAFFIVLTGYKLLMDDWRGYFIAGFALVWIANMYMGIFLFLKQSIKKEKTEIECLEIEKEKEKLL
jgi:hypothetical protein